MPNAFALIAFACLAADARPGLEVDARGFAAGFDSGALVRLVDADGTWYVSPADRPAGLGVHTLSGEFHAGAGEGPGRLGADGRAVQRCTGFDGLDGVTAQCKVSLDKAAGEIVCCQAVGAGARGEGSPAPSVRPASRAAGVWGVSWSIGRIPLDFAILVPGRSGIRLTADSPGRRQQFDYPIGWEAQLVIVEGDKRGFYVWAEDPRGRFKRLVVERHCDGWQLTLVTINYAPFDDLTACESVPWRLGVYQGDWRVPARRYREWMEQHFQPVPIDQQKPAWVGDVRCLVIMGLDREMLAELPKRLDPAQTILYVPSWRSAGYDRDYPTYDAPLDSLEPFVNQAHGLGFRVMLHVNYFGVDPKHPLYEQFERYQVRSPWGNHERQWWLWDRAQPEIRFAYINPACRAWRESFVKHMATLCRRYEIDALHLDQTLCIYNDHNGLLDGMSMIDGNLALHRELREALPEVALSGEGLNEVTCRYEAFAQRHAWGVNHADGTWNRRPLACAHPISSYLLRPYTVINGYLGCAPPTHGQMYAAWNEAYEHWGVIPTLKPNLDQLRRPADFSRQFFDEADFWLRNRLQIDLEAAWPADVAFPFRTADGRRAVRTVDGRFCCANREVSHTLTGVGQLATTGTIPGWRAYDDQRLLGLDPERWYPCFDEPRDPHVFHAALLPDDVICEAVVSRDELAVFRSRSRETIVADLVARMDSAACESRPFAGLPSHWVGAGAAEDGGSFQDQDDGVLAAHPPWKAVGKNPDTGAASSGGTGIACARFQVELPAAPQLVLVSQISLAREAAQPNRSDGVTFIMAAAAGATRREQLWHHASEDRRQIELDITALAGQTATVELAVDPGPKRSASYDWACWTSPRIERRGRRPATIGFAGSVPDALAVDQRGLQSLRREGAVLITDALQPGSVFLLRQQPPQVTLPLNLADQPRTVVFVDDSGREWIGPEHAAVRPERLTVGGVTKDGLFAHPPNHGRTIAYLPLTLPNQPLKLSCAIGVRDGSTSEGVVFAVEANGAELARRRMVPGAWETLTVDLSDLAGKPVVLGLVTDSDGTYSCDWACWGEPVIQEAETHADRR
ncbi:MAG: hypothetical protein GX575_33350 [Candidatus Anammoximicrobium sp.]|nr:hypothetical protein [Candidatus Anammoximicrobium sp.]